MKKFNEDRNCLPLLCSRRRGVTPGGGRGAMARWPKIEKMIMFLTSALNSELSQYILSQGAVTNVIVRGS